MYMASGGDSLNDPNGIQPAAEADIEKTYEEASWANMPPPIFYKLCRKMSGSFIHTARQVCPHWLANLEHDIGLCVKIDDKETGNLEFIKNIKVVQARIVNLRDTAVSDDNSLLMFPTCLRKLTLSGTMPVDWKLSYLKQFQGLSHLVIRGSALHTQDLTGSPLPSEDAVSLLSIESRSTIYDNYEPAIEPHAIWFRKLQKLELVMNEFSYPSVLPLSVRLHNPDRAIEHETHLKRLYFIVLNNVTYILNNIRSHRLRVAQFYIYPKAGTIPPPKLNWKHTPLQRFLLHHKKTLRELYLPDFEGKHDNTNADLWLYPTLLTKLQLTLSSYIGDREEGRLQNTEYWKQFLSEQTQLVDIYVIFTDLSSEWLVDCLSSLAFSCKDTLTYVDIVIDLLEETVQVNMEIFSFCHNLEVLKLSGKETEIIVRNFCKLSESVKKLYINTAIVEFPDEGKIEKFRDLEMLELKTVALGGGTDLTQRNTKSLALVKAFINLRHLSLLSLNFDTPLNPNANLLELLKDLDPYFDSSYPIFSVKLNLSYEMECGWSEEIFDEDKLDIEYINNREPEEYNSFQSRHRNAISVDDEDHRIFIFQTLPFLLDVRGRRQDDWDGRGNEADTEPDSDEAVVDSDETSMI